jgi:hypothetical protein
MYSVNKMVSNNIWVHLSVLIWYRSLLWRTWGPFDRQLISQSIYQTINQSLLVSSPFLYLWPDSKPGIRHIWLHCLCIYLDKKEYCSHKHKQGVRWMCIGTNWCLNIWYSLPHFQVGIIKLILFNLKKFRLVSVSSLCLTSKNNFPPLLCIQ